MSIKHPVIAVTGSSGAGTTTVMKSLAQIFRREGINPQMIEGESFHRFDRKRDARARRAAENGKGRSHQPFRSRGEPARRARGDIRGVRRAAAPARCAVIFTTPAEAKDLKREAWYFTDWET